MAFRLGWGLVCRFANKCDDLFGWLVVGLGCLAGGLCLFLGAVGALGGGGFGGGLVGVGVGVDASWAVNFG